MARIPTEELERLKQEVSIQRLAEARGVKLKAHGKDLIGLCPFHDDREPSLVVTPSKNLWHCLGACQAGGSVIDWVMRSEGVSFRHAVEILRVGFSPAPNKGKKIAKRSSVPKLPILATHDADDSKLLGQVVDYYHRTLKESPQVLDYLKKRGLVHPELIEHFKLGFSSRTLGYRLPAKSREAGAQIRGQLQKLGILRKSGHEHFRGCLVIPVLDDSGRAVEIYGRRIRESSRAPKHLYLPGPHRGVFNVEAFKASKEIILCEALIDALTFWCAGFRHVTSSFGVEGFTAELLSTMEEHGTERVLIAYDRDEAGDRAALALAKRLLSKGIECFRVVLPRGLDANAYALKVTPAKKSLSLVLDKAVWMGSGLDPCQVESVELVSKSQAPAAVEPQAPPSPSPSPSPLAAAAAIAADVTGKEVVIQLGDRRYRIRGLSKNLSFEQLKVNILCSHGTGFHVDTLDLYSAKQRVAYQKQAAVEIGVREQVVKHDLGKILLKLEHLQEQLLKKADEDKDKAPVVSDAEQEEALLLLKDLRLTERILRDFRTCGVVGEKTNKLLGYLACVSRKLEEPLAVVIQSSSAAGKSSLMEAILAFMPDEERVKYSAMTGQSLFYMGEKNLKHKVLAIVEEEGAERASYALKLLQSEGELCIASTGKDPATGRLITHEYRVEGPVAILLTTTAIDVDEELMNRCLVLTVDEQREQTRAIHVLQRQRQTLEGLLLHQERARLLKLHQNAQRLLRPLLVANPYANELTFLDTKTRTRRDHVKYLTLIRTVALLHQYQRSIKTVSHKGRTVQYIEVTPQDIALANDLAHEALGRSLDELPPQTRRLLHLIDDWVTEMAEENGENRCDVSFTRRQLRDRTECGDTQLKLHLRRLLDLEYLAVFRGDRGRFVYELLYDSQSQKGSRFLPGLIDVARLEHGEYDTKRSGSETKWSDSKAKRSAPGRPLVGPRSAPGRGGKNGTNPNNAAAILSSELSFQENAVLGGLNCQKRSYVVESNAAETVEVGGKPT